MKTKRFLALTMALSMTAGAMTVLPSASAEGNSTDLELVVAEPENVYTMTVPAKTTMNSDGTEMALTNGLKIKGSNMTRDVVVTMTGANDWTMKAEGKETTIRYNVYGTSACTDAVTSVEFDKTAIGTEAGSTKDLYVMPNATDLEAAEAGTYTGAITFTAGLHETTIKDIMNPGTEWTVSFDSGDASYDVSFKTNDDKTIENTEVLTKGNGEARVEDTYISGANSDHWSITVSMQVFVLDSNGHSYGSEMVDVIIDALDNSVSVFGEDARASGLIVDGTDISSKISLR